MSDKFNPAELSHEELVLAYKLLWTYAEWNWHENELHKSAAPDLDPYPCEPCVLNDQVDIFLKRTSQGLWKTEGELAALNVGKDGSAVELKDLPLGRASMLIPSRYIKANPQTS